MSFFNRSATNGKLIRGCMKFKPSVSKLILVFFRSCKENPSQTPSRPQLTPSQNRAFLSHLKETKTCFSISKRVLVVVRFRHRNSSWTTIVKCFASSPSVRTCLTSFTITWLMTPLKLESAIALTMAAKPLLRSFEDRNCQTAMM
jgi:hypothetical protein